MGSGVARKMLGGSCVPFPVSYLICLPKSSESTAIGPRLGSGASRTHGPCDGGALHSPTPAQCTPRRTLPMPSASASGSSAPGSSRKGKRKAGPAPRASAKQRVGAAQKPAAGSFESVDLTVTDDEDAQADAATGATGTVQTTCAAMVAAAEAHKQCASAPPVGGAFDLASLTEKFKQAAEHAAKQAAEQAAKQAAEHAEQYINERNTLWLAEVQGLTDKHLSREKNTRQESQRQLNLLLEENESMKASMIECNEELDYTKEEMSAAQQRAEDADKMVDEERRLAALVSDQLEHICKQHDETEVKNKKRAAADFEAIRVLKRKLDALKEVEERNRCGICLGQLHEVVTGPFLFCTVDKAPPHFVCQGCYQMQFDNTNPLDPALLRCPMRGCGGMFSVADQERVLGPERCAKVVKAQDDAIIAAAEERGAERARAGDCKLTQEDYIDATIDRMPCCGRKYDPLATCIDEGECAVIFCQPCAKEFCAFCHEQFPLHDYVNNDGQESAGHGHLKYCQENHFQMLEDGTLQPERRYHPKGNPQAIASLKACGQRRVAERLANLLANKVADAGN